MKKLYNFNDFITEGKKAIIDSPLIQEIYNLEIGRILIDTILNYYKNSKNIDLKKSDIMRDNGQGKIYFPSSYPTATTKVYLEKVGTSYTTYDIYSGRISNNTASSKLDEALFNLWKRFISIVVKEDVSLTRKKFRDWLDLDINKDLYKKKLKISELELMYKKTLIEGRGESSKGLTDDQIMWLNSVVKGKWKVDNNLIEVKGDIIINCKEILVPFSSCSGVFEIKNGSGLINLKGSPKKVGKNFNMNYNDMESLEGGPEYVGDSVRIGTEIYSLKGLPIEIKKSLKLGSLEKLKSLKELFNSKIHGNINLIFTTQGEDDVHKISLLMKKENLKYEETLLKLWPDLSEYFKKKFINDLPSEGLGNVIKKSNKFGMNI